MIRDAGRPGAIPNHPHRGATMPQHVRNFWIAADIDGRREPLQGGPARADGGFTMTVYQRRAGEVMPALAIAGVVDDDGSLHLTAHYAEGGSSDVLVVRTER